MLSIQQFVVNPFEENTYVLSDDATSEALIIDPGMMFDNERKAVTDFIDGKGLKPLAVVNTHMHLDHCFSDNAMKERYSIPVKAHQGDAELGRGIARQARRFGMADLKPAAVEIDEPVADGDIIRIGEDSLRVLHTPGHSPGGICLYDERNKYVFVGDTLFCGSIGRTDLAGGSYEQLIESIRTKLMALPDDVTVLSGHGPHTTIGRERGRF